MLRFWTPSHLNVDQHFGEMIISYFGVETNCVFQQNRFQSYTKVIENLMKKSVYEQLF